LLVPNPADSALQDWFTRTVDAQQTGGVLRAFHKLLLSADPHSIPYLSTYEMIGSLADGSLPAYDQMAESYTLFHDQQPAWTVSYPEALAVWYERQRRIIQHRLHPRLIDALHDQHRVRLFARALLCDVITTEHHQGTLRIGARIDSQGFQPFAIHHSENPSSWLSALRWFTIAADHELVQAIEDAVQKKWPPISAEAFDQWIERGPLLADLRTSTDPAEQDLTALLVAILEPAFEVQA
jgi:hypothetical protein